jgi:hypothetical protein
MPSNPKSSSKQSSRQYEARFRVLNRFTRVMVLCGFFLLCSFAYAQSDVPLLVKNPKKQTFPAGEAGRIYASVCMVVGREVRPEHPLALRPRFTLILGSDADQLVQRNQETELHLKSWDREKFAQAVVILAGREILKTRDVVLLGRRALSLTDAVVPVAELAEAK